MRAETHLHGMIRPTGPSRRAALALVLLAACSCQEQARDTQSPATSPGTSEFPELFALRGTDGTLAYTEEELDGSVDVERNNGDGWQVIGSGGALWWSDDAAQGTGYRLSQDGTTGPVVYTEPIELSASSEQQDQLLLEGGEIEIQVQLSGPQTVPELALTLRKSSDGQNLYLDAGCGTGSDCWGADPVALETVTDATESWTLAAQSWADTPRHDALGAALEVEVDGTWHTLAYGEVPFVALAVSYAWGDLHAHSNLSYDGCEVEDDICSERGDVPGEDFFDNAIGWGLDFVAMTEHAEWETYYPDGDVGGTSYDIWDGQIEAVAEVTQEGFIPLLGSEWTRAEPNFDPEETFDGGHKTFVFQNPEVCEAYRVAASGTRDDHVKGNDGGLVIPGNDYQASTPADIWPLLDAAAEECGEEPVLTFYHHPAFEHPAPADWENEKNAPDSRYETLVEVYSEHGSSECVDPESSHCDWNLKLDSVYYGEQGSVQTALAVGFQLGFVAGTDSHNADPGSLENDPSCTANFTDTDLDGTVDTPRRHDYTGGLTGALYGGEFSRETLFPALQARHTVATSGPRAELTIAALGDDDEVYLPGDALPPEAFPARLAATDLQAALEDAGAELAGVDLVGHLGEILETTDGPSLETDIDLSPGDAVYLRLRVVWNDSDERMWVSPFFGALDDSAEP